MELEEAKERCKKLVEAKNASWIGISNQKAINTVLTELEKKDKIIDLMANYIAILDIDKNLCTKVEDSCYDYAGQNGKTCEGCIKQYFEKKVEGE